MPDLSVNIDHVATVRQARRAAEPDPVEAAALAERAGATGITAHLRSDRRHVSDRDIERLAEAVTGKLNVEMATTDEMLEIALGIRPGQVTLVPEHPDEITTEGGLDVTAHHARVQQVAARLAEHEIDVSVFVDPDPAQIDALGSIGPSAVSGFEINTDRYSKADDSDRGASLDLMRQVAEHGHAAGFRIYAGHGLTVANVGPVAALPYMEELNIGHSIVSRAVLIGMDAAVREMLTAMRAS